MMQSDLDNMRREYEKLTEKQRADMRMKGRVSWCGLDEDWNDEQDEEPPAA